MDFHKVTVDNDIEAFSEADLRELVAEYRDAQTSNLELFEEVSEKMGEYREYEDELTEELVDASPLAESEVADVSFNRKRELLAEFDETGQSTDSEAGEGEEFDEEDGGSKEFGQRGETHTDEKETEDFIESQFESMSGVEP
jgi:hypothetical protein